MYQRVRRPLRTAVRPPATAPGGAVGGSQRLQANPATSPSAQQDQLQVRTAGSQCQACLYYFLTMTGRQESGRWEKLCPVLLQWTWGESTCCDRFEDIYRGSLSCLKP
jgi:hypothetical protein